MAEEKGARQSRRGYARHHLCQPQQSVWGVFLAPQLLQVFGAGFGHGFVVDLPLFCAPLYLKRS